VTTTVKRDSLDAPEPETQEKHRNPVLQFLGELPGLILMAFILALLIKTFLIQAFYIPSGSMEPTLEPGDRVIVVKVPYYFHDPQRGDVIVFEDPDPSKQPDRGLVGGVVHWLVQGLGAAPPDNEDFVKRVIGLPGETVWAKNGHVFVDGVRIQEPYLTQKTDDFPHTKVPADSLFVMGDNRGNSLDSRFGLGFVPLGQVIGKADFVIWPPSRAGGID
jgi:signal peptidase I